MSTDVNLTISIPSPVHMAADDYAQVQADDALLDRISAGHRVETTDPALVWLMAWRDAVDAEPIRELVEPRVAVARVRAAAARRRRTECA